MDARRVAAQFAALTWYEESRVGKRSRNEAARFAKENWNAFLPVAHEGWGKLLIRVISQRPKRNSIQWRNERRSLAFAV
jgi:hypothetical protein